MSPNGHKVPGLPNAVTCGQLQPGLPSSSETLEIRISGDVPPPPTFTHLLGGVQQDLPLQEVDRLLDVANQRSHPSL